VKRRAGTAAGSRRDLRLAVFGGCCTALGGAFLLLAACTVDSPRIEPAPQPPPSPPVEPLPHGNPTGARLLPCCGERITLVSPASKASNFRAVIQPWSALDAMPRTAELQARRPTPVPTRLVTISSRSTGCPRVCLPAVPGNTPRFVTSGDRALIWQLMRTGAGKRPVITAEYMAG
jgi:hypothetical protein